MAGTLILATHGIAGGPGAAAAHASAIRARSAWQEVRVGCLKAEPSLAEAMAGAPELVIVVPLLMSAGFIHEAGRALPRPSCSSATAPRATPQAPSTPAPWCSSSTGTASRRLAKRSWRSRRSRCRQSPLSPVSA